MDGQNFHQRDYRARKWRMDWPEKLAIVALVAAAAMLLSGRVAAAIALLLCGFMGWTRVFEHNRSQGKSTLSDKGRVIVGGLLGLVAGAAILLGSHQSSRVTSTPEPGGEGNLAASSISSADKGNRPSISAADGLKMERKNSARINEMLASLKALRQGDYEARLTFWNDIVALAPANPDYARKRREIADRVASLDELRETPEEGMVVEKVRGRKEAFGNVLVIDITLRNDSLSNLKDFPITCESKGRSGTVITTTTRDLYEVVKARSSRTFRKVNMGLVNHQAVSATCIVGRATVA